MRVYYSLASLLQTLITLDAIIADNPNIARCWAAYKKLMELVVKDPQRYGMEPESRKLSRFAQLLFHLQVLSASPTSPVRPLIPPDVTPSSRSPPWTLIATPAALVQNTVFSGEMFGSCIEQDFEVPGDESDFVNVRNNKVRPMLPHPFRILCTARACGEASHLHPLGPPCPPQVFLDEFFQSVKAVLQSFASTIGTATESQERMKLTGVFGPWCTVGRVGGNEAARLGVEAERCGCCSRGWYWFSSNSALCVWCIFWRK